MLDHRKSHTGSLFFRSYSCLDPCVRLVDERSTLHRDYSQAINGYRLTFSNELARESPEMLLILVTWCGDVTSLWFMECLVSAHQQTTK